MFLSIISALYVRSPCFHTPACISFGALSQVRQLSVARSLAGNHCPEARNVVVLMILSHDVGCEWLESVPLIR